MDIDPNVVIGVAVVIVSVLISMTMHEAMLAYVANWLGDDTARLSGRLTLNPFQDFFNFCSVILSP